MSVLDAPGTPEFTHRDDIIVLEANRMIQKYTFNANAVVADALECLRAATQAYNEAHPDEVSA